MRAIISCLLVGLIFSSTVLAQMQMSSTPISSTLPPRPAAINLEAPMLMPSGTSEKVSIRLLDNMRKPAVADEDIRLHVSASGADVDNGWVVIPKGKDFAEFTVTKTRQGVSEVRVEPPNTILGATTEISSAPRQNYVPVPPISMSVALSPRPRLWAGLDVGKITVRLLDQKKTPIVADQKIAVAFPELSQDVSPHPLRIPKGSAYGIASLKAGVPGTYTVIPVISPPTMYGSPIIADKLSVEFASPIMGLRIIADPSYVRSVVRPTIRLKVGLVDLQGNWIASDMDRTVVIHTEPTATGRLATSDLTIRKGTSVAETAFVPYQEGVVTVGAAAGLLPVEAAKLEFHYATLFFWLISALGGLVGGIVRYFRQTPRNLKKLFASIGAGIFLGVLVYVLAPFFVGLEFKQFQNQSKILEAFIWGILGGATGATLIWKLVAQEGAAAPH